MLNHSISVKIRWEMGHRLSHGYKGPCANIHGHSYSAVFDFDGDINKQGFISDFKDIKKAVKGFIDDKLDHVLMISDQDPEFDEITALNTVVLALDRNPTAENISHWLYCQVRKMKGLPTLKQVQVTETENCSATCDDYEQ